ncbi:hypothetical protein Anas_03590 [Armadillidium nasatum]|uniref:Pericentriolar material 1 protein n=1 Tax=Armadillidium nasatum TaxID=96803 RepID=A0A5N5TK71_9CRUS|nr:hypothetical protein Anas_03590 [Armadillidium nasatum]
MTFSDAEEDQPSVLQSGTLSNRMSDSSRGSSSLEASVNEATQSENGQIAASENPSNHTSEINPENEPFPNSNTCNVRSSDVIQENGYEEPRSNDNQANNVEEALEINGDSMVAIDSNMKDLGTEKTLEKLQQIHGYIQQTAAAMEALEREGDLIGQYNTLVKCMRDLRKSETKLTAHLNKIKEKSTRNLHFEESLLKQYESLVKESKTKDDEYSDLSNTLRFMEGVVGSGSESIGVVGDINESVSGRPSMEERLARHETEQQQLSERLRESLVRREELMARYQATRERLNNLKRQRQGLVKEERKLLLSVGASENLYENPVPGAESWTTEQLEGGIKDFQGLREKVEHLHEAYSTKLQTIDENDTEARNEIQQKIDQILMKRSQIGDALTQLNHILSSRRESTEEGASSIDSAVGENNAILSSNDSTSVEATTQQVENENTSLETLENGLKVIEERSDAEKGAAGSNYDPEELQSKQQHLQSLKDQLLSMKKLLQVTQNSLPQGNEIGGNRNETQNIEENAVPHEEQQEDETEAPLIDSTIVGVNGEVIHLSETERRNPQVVEKYRQLSEAKQRLAKMEEVMKKIAEARENGMSLTEVLSPENMAILNEARREEEEANSVNEETTRMSVENDEQRGVREKSSESVKAANESCSSAPSQMPFEQINLVFKPKTNQSRANSDNRVNGKNKWETEREISAIQSHFKKKTPGIPSVNEGPKFDHEKGAIKKQAREIINERPCDPRLREVAALQEELKEKKNALEALMRRMGKSSSFTVDNISDNISENISDLNSETFEKPAASWGPSHSQGRYYSDHYQSDEEHIDTNEEELSFSLGNSQGSFPSHRRAVSSLPASLSNVKNRNKLPASRCNHSSEHNRFSVNNLTGTRSVPVTSWENMSNPNSSSLSNSNNKVQNTVTAALSQLSQVQETINSLYGELKSAEVSMRQQEAPSFDVPNANASVPQFPLGFVSPQTYMSNFCVSSLPNSQATGRGDFAPSNHILAGLQQCFSQLYLHSLEIQSLSKHLQREKPVMPHPKEQQRSSSSERRSLERRINENFSPQYQEGFRAAANIQNTQNHVYENRKSFYSDHGDSAPRIPPSDRLPPTRSGLSNTVSANSVNLHPRQSSWQMDSRVLEEIDTGDKNVFHPFETAEEMQQSNANADLGVDSTLFTFDSDDIGEQLSWANVSNIQLQQQSSDILNNQVLPGTRANNYWDNFRSYSRQNPLSTTAKRNTGDHFSLSGNSSPGRRPTVNMGSRLQPPLLYANKTRHSNSSYSGNTINKASDKNSSSSRSQNRTSGRMRYFDQHVNGGHHVPANTLPCGAASSLNAGPEVASYKRDNRHDCEEISEQMTDRNCTGDKFSLLNMVNNSEEFKEVVREAESLMEKHSEQPQFLLHLFHHAAKITSSTNQQVALELLRELSYQRHRNNIENNRWASNSSVTQSAHSDIFAIPKQTKETDKRKRRFSNKNSRTDFVVSGSDASESELTSDEEESKAMHHIMKNLTPTSSRIGIYPLISSPQTASDLSNNPSSVGVSPIHLSNAIHPNRHSQSEPRKDIAKDIVNIVTPAANKEKDKSENQYYESRTIRKDGEVHSRNHQNGASLNYSSSTPNLLHEAPKSDLKLKVNVCEESFYPPDEKHNNKRQFKKLPRRSNPRASQEKANFSIPKNEKKNVNPKSHPPASGVDGIQQSVSGFEALVSSSLREVLICFENTDYSIGSLTHILENLHMSIMRQVQFHSTTLGFSSNFVSSIDSQLKATLRRFNGESLGSIRQELAAAVTQVLIQEYCALFLQYDNKNSTTENQIPEAKFSADPYSLKGTGSESCPKTAASQSCKHGNSASLFINQGNVKRNRTSNATWSLKPTVPSENEQTNNEAVANSNHCTHLLEEEGKSSKSKGAISKTSSPFNPKSAYKEETYFANQDVANVFKIENPYPEGSSFSQSWNMPRGCNNNQTESNASYSLTETLIPKDKSKDRNVLEMDETLSFERNDAEADQEEHIRQSDFDDCSLPVHDLAEADQSQDTVEAECVDSSIENDQYEAAVGSNPTSNKEPKEFSLKFLSKKKSNPEQGLDEVPTRLLNALDSATNAGSGVGRFYNDENTESRIPPTQRCAHFSHQSALQSTPANSSVNDQTLTNNHITESSSGKFD